MNHKERMLAGLPYRAWLDGLSEERMSCAVKLHAYNLIRPDKQDELDKALVNILGKAGGGTRIMQPFHCDYGWNIEVGDNFFANYNCVILDVARVQIGRNIMLGPNVSVYTAGHPIHPDSRNTGLEYGVPATIGDNVWIGGGTVINPGVTIGSNAVIGSGSVVTRDIPPNVIAVGNPCRVIRAITDADRRFYYKDRVFDTEDI
ncbi:MAG: sugar O-acetyltransferase [Clostridiales bacterium]|nr:sugar O-acetyltransferase [Clostridiales bacterium]